MQPQSVVRDERRAGFWAGILILFILVAGVVSFIVARYQWWLQPLASVQGRVIDEYFYAILLATAIGFVATHIFLAVALMRYTARGKERAAHWHEHLGAELTWTLVPGAAFIFLGILGVFTWSRLYSAPPANAQIVEVTGRQFFWYIRYPGPDGKLARTDPTLISQSNPLGLDPNDPATKANLVVTNELHLVAGRPVEVRIRSIDVIHSFFLPNFRVKQDAVPGRTVDIWFTPDKPGNYQIACAQLCGVGHYTMRGNVTVESQTAFEQWLQQQAAH
ncbi:MAG TPA: cytochrome c oxidase subunit II [bacterium]|nr:cytochrome c oxidase subunit II [bacterium]